MYLLYCLPTASVIFGARSECELVDKIRQTYRCSIDYIEVNPLNENTLTILCEGWYYAIPPMIGQFFRVKSFRRLSPERDLVVLYVEDVRQLLFEYERE